MNGTPHFTAYDRLTEHLHRLRSRVMTRRLARGAVAFLSWLVAGATIALVAQGVFGPRFDLGVVLGIALLAVVVVMLWRFLVGPATQFPSLRRFAMGIDREIDERADETINALDLGRRREAEHDPLSRDLADHAIARNLPRIVEVDEKRLDRGPRYRPYLVVLALAGTALGIFYAVAPMRLTASFLALLNPTRFPYSPGVTIEVLPGDQSVDTGTDLAVHAVVTGIDEPARVLYRKEGGAWKSAPMTGVSRSEVAWEGHLDGSQVTVTQEITRAEFETTLPELRRNTEYRVRVGERESEVFLVSVLTPPRVAGYRISTDFPDYTGLPTDDHAAPVGNVSALVGSEVTVRPETEGEVGGATVEWSTGVTQSLDSADASFTFTMAEPVEYRVRVADSHGRTRFESPYFPVEPLADRDPIVRVLDPGEDVDVPDGMKLDMSVKVADDFGIDRLLLHVHKEPHEPYATTVRAFDSDERETIVDFKWDLGSLDLLPGEVATYWFELFDNDTVSGPKSTRTPVYEIRFPSMAELYERTEEEYSEDVVNTLDEINTSEKKLHERLQSMRQELERSREGVTWEKQKEVESMMEAQESLQQELSQAMESLQRSIDRLDQNSMSNFQILERMQAVQSLLDEVDDEVLQAMMERVREALETMDTRELQEALDTFEMTQEDILQHLDRAVEHLKQLLAEQQLESLTKQIQDLLEEQARVNAELDERADEANAADEISDEDLAQVDPTGEADAGEPSDQEAGDESPDGESAEGENAESESSEGESAESESAEGESAESESSEGENSEGESSESESEGGESSESESSESESESQDGESSSSEGSESESEGSESESEGSESESEGSESQSEGSESQSSESPSGESSDSPSMEELAERQEQLAQQLEELMEKLAELQESASENHPQMEQALNEQSPQQSGSRAQEAMEQAEEQMQGQQGESALRYGLEAQDELQQMANQMQAAGQQMQAGQAEELSAEMLKLGADLLHISNKQEEVVVSPDGSTTRDLAAQEMRLYEATGRAAEKLDEISQQTMMISQGMLRSMGAVLDDMNHATTLYEGGNRTRGTREAHAAMSGLNRAVMDLLRVRNQMSQSASACSNPNPMSRVPSLSQMQQQINRQTLSLREQIGRQRLSPATGQEALRQLAARQQAVQRGIEEIAGELENRRDVLGRVDQMGKEIEDIVEQLEQGNVDRDVLHRQEKILSRLLAAERSIRKQDQDDRRISRSGQEKDRTSPAALAEQDLGRPDRIDLDIMQGRTDPFPPRYRSMIESYFKALGEDK